MTHPQFYKTPTPVSLHKILTLLNVACPAVDLTITGINTLEEAGAQEMAACFDKKALSALAGTKAGACFVTEEFVSAVPSSTQALCVKNPRFMLAKAGHFLYPEVRSVNATEGRESCAISSSASIAPTAFIGKGASIGAHTHIGPGVCVGEGVQIGAHCRIHDNVTVTHAVIGDHVHVHSGARIGSAGFGFVHEGMEIVDIPHLGRVVIKSHVRIGANTTIDRGVFGDTFIGDGTHIDNLVQIAHNVHLGKGCIVVAQVGISGSTHMGDFSIIAGQAGIAGHLKIGKKVTIAAQSGVMRDIADGETVGGTPAVPIREWHRQVLYLSKAIKK